MDQIRGRNAVEIMVRRHARGPRNSVAREMHPATCNLQLTRTPPSTCRYSEADAEIRRRLTVEGEFAE
jgi:hypothetical protein